MKQVIYTKQFIFADLYFWNPKKIISLSNKNY